jgi:hypothetical protein
MTEVGPRDAGAGNNASEARPYQRTDFAASRMMSTTRSGCEYITTCDELTSVMRASARFAMNSWVAGGMALSWVVTRYQDGIVFQAGTPDLLLKASTENGR